MISNLVELFESFYQSNKKAVDDDDYDHLKGDLLVLFKDSFLIENEITFDIKGHMDADINGGTLADLRAKKPRFVKFTFDSNMSFEIDMAFVRWRMHPEFWTDKTPIFGKNKFKISENFTCKECGEHVYTELDLETKTIMIPERLTDNVKQCPIAVDDPREPSVDISVPSGKIIFSNDLRAVLSEAELALINNKSSELSSYEGIKSEMVNSAEFGLFFSYVGNTCPSIIRDKEKNIFISSPHEYSRFNKIDSDDYDYDFEKDDNIEYLGGICTDLWWFSAMDYDLYQKKCKENNFKECQYQDYHIVDVEPGEYRLTSYCDARKPNGNFASIVKVK